MWKKRQTSPIYVDNPEDYPNIPVIKRQSKKLIAFGWYGGKYSKLDFILPLLPKCKHYVEPFGGSGAVLLNREKSPVETYNDIDGEIVNFFRMMREKPNDLIKAIELTPYSREEYMISIYGPHDGIDNLERARRFFVIVNMTHFKIYGKATLGQWSYTINHDGSPTYSWQNSKFRLNNIIDRLKYVQIENRPAVDVIKKYDTANTLFYLDPPYLLQTRTGGNGYKYEMDNDEYEKFFEAVNSTVGMVAISGYDHPIMDKYLPSPKWFKIFDKPRLSSSTKPTGSKSDMKFRTEVLWTNYDPQKLSDNKDLLL